MSVQFTMRSALLCLAFTAAATVLQAQEVATSLDQVRVLVKRGETVTVSDTAGRDITGRVTELSSDRLALLVEGTRHELAEADVRMITQRRHGSLGTGAKWGLAAGAGFGAILALTNDWSNQSDVPAGVATAAGIGFYAGLGSAIGVGVSAATRQRHVVFAKPGTSLVTLTMSPLLTRERKGIALSVRF